MIIGLTGSYASGKDTAADYIIRKFGFEHFSLSDIIREEMKAQGVEPTRENLIVFGTKLRAQNGNGVLSKMAIKKTDSGKNYCITSIRHPDEVLELKKNANFILIDIDAPAKIRFERMKKRNRNGDPQDFDTFVKLEQKESQEEGSGQQLSKTAALADIKITNDSDDVKNLEKQIDALIKKFENK
ncbi:MAG: AAA family ATPase [Elusimicrobiota bacterium]|jgi:dephospho-CoA kinase|nr:AAA family ATPase [Elusimicrobiota bacterium]